MGAPRGPDDLPDSLAANREELRRRARAERIRPVWLWVGILTGPVAFLVVRIASIVLVSHACGRTAGTNFLGLSTPQLEVGGVTVLGALATIGAGIVSWRIWRQTSMREDEVSVGNMPGTPFWALGGLLLSAFFLLAIVITGGLALALNTGCS